MFERGSLVSKLVRTRSRNSAAESLTMTPISGLLRWAVLMSTFQQLRVRYLTDKAECAALNERYLRTIRDSRLATTG